MNNLHKDHGMALIIVLMFTLLISFLTFAIYESCKLEVKMTNYTAMKSLTRIAALKTLEIAEHSLKTQSNLPRNAAIKFISNRVCGVDFYRVTAVEKIAHVTTKLQSTFAIINPLTKCRFKPIVKEGRKSYLEIE
jgi:Tfp pilus assembly protein PilX